MGNILFYYDNYSGPWSKGGTEIATWRIAAALKERREKVFDAYRKGTGPDSREKDCPEKNIWAGVIRLSKNPQKFSKDLSNFIRENEIGAVVNMSRFFRNKLLLDAIGKSGRDVRLFFMQHFAPGSERKKTTFGAAWRLLRLDPLNPLYWLRMVFYPLVKLPRTLSWNRIYREVYEKSDGVVVLSKGYFEDYAKIGKLKERSKMAAIPNIYDGPTDAGETKKEKRVLILSRMDEIQKRLSLALRIWQKIEQEKDLADWHLDIVGTGHDARGLKRLAKRLGLKNATFHGWQESRPFLERSSILMMTSEYEGLSLSMLEAQAYGCVPIAFNSYASLKDVVEDGVNGVVVEKFGDTDTFAERLGSLMRDPEKLLSMQKACRRGNSAFTSEAVADQWQKLLNLDNR